MSELSFVPLDRLDVFGDDVGDFTTLFADPGRMEHASAFLLVRHEDWSDDPLYYILAREDLEELARAAGARNLELEQLSRELLFEYLDVHEYTRAPRVSTGVEPAQRAVVLDDAGQVEGVWAEVQPPPMAANGGDDSDRESTPSIPSFNVDAAPVDTIDVGAERRGDEEPLVDTFWRRTPHMDVSEPEPLAAGVPFVAAVYLDTGEARPGEESQGVVLDLPEELEIVDIEVMLVASQHFAIQRASLQTLSMHRDDDESPKLEFELTVVDAPRLDAPASLTAYLTYNQRPCGLVHRSVALQGAAAVPAAEAPQPEPAPELAIDARAEPADLTVQIVEDEEKDGRHFRVLLRTTLDEKFTMAEAEPWVFREGTDTFVTNLMAEFTKKGASAFARQASLKGAGVELWETAPECFRTLLWRLIDDGAPLRTIYIVSAEPSIPWELMRPRRNLENGDLEQREPLGVEFVVGRWVHPEHRSPKQQDPIEDSYVVAPDYRVRKLAKSAAEAEWVCKQFAGVAITPAIQERIEEVFAERSVGLVHFIAHGKSQPGAAQTLDLDDDAVLPATQIKGGLPNLEKAFRAKAPLVFINACEVGRMTPSLVGAGGFAQAFLYAGARGVVAPLWSVKDSLAHEVALTFYEAALERPSRQFADILTDIRKLSYAEGGGEDSYAAYCWYGDPLTALDPSA